MLKKYVRITDKELTARTVNGCFFLVELYHNLYCLASDICIKITSFGHNEPSFSQFKP
jgi:hypothetical protein